MSGTIEVSSHARWSAAGWIFDWTVGYLAEHASDPRVAAQLREIVSDNLGWLGLDDYGPSARTDLVGIITKQLLPAAESALPATIANRASAIDLLRELAELAADDAAA
jgi:hypothetical protein